MRINDMKPPCLGPPPIGYALEVRESVFFSPLLFLLFFFSYFFLENSSEKGSNRHLT